MYKLMIVEDDIPTLKYLKGVINWNKLGVEIGCATSSSMNALEVLEQVKPDIILTDIGLPHISGLELAARALEKNPLIRVTFLTCHEEFSYAKEAVKLNADDYLIKDGLTAEILEKSIKKTVSTLIKQDIHDRQSFVQNIHFLKSALLNKFIDQSNDEVLEYYINMLNKSWKAPDYKMMFGYLPLSLTESNVDYATSLEKVYYTLSEFLFEHEEIEVFINDTHIVLFLNYKVDIKIDIEAHLNEILYLSIEHCQKELAQQVNFVVVKQSFKLNNIGKNLEQIVQNRILYAYRPVTSIQTIDLDSKYSFIPLGNQFNHKKNELLQAIESESEEQLEETIDGIYEQVTLEDIEPQDILNELINVLSLIEFRVPSAVEGKSFSKQLSYCWTMDELLDYFRQVLKDLSIQEEPKKVSGTDTKKMREIDNYIARNLDHHIRSIDMAKHLYFNPSYFSRYFKRLTGTTFTDYVNEYKMKAASRYLLNTDEPIESIALKVGYNERTYFSKVFKKNVGITPSEYRNNKRVV